MNSLRIVAVAIAALSFLPTTIHAADKPDYKTGKLTDLRQYETEDPGAARAQWWFCLSVEMDDMSYILRYESFARWSYKPTDFIVGDPVQVRVKGNDMYLGKPKGGDLKTKIVRRARNAPDKPPITCALPVSTQN
jgi:hypothetical protein